MHRTAHFAIAAATLLSAIPCLRADAGRADAAPWHHPLYLGNGEVWRQRIAVTATNGAPQPVEGAPSFLRVGKGAGEADIAGRRIEEIRVVDALGREMLYAVLDPAGAPLTSGPVPAGGRMAIPVECGGGAAAQYFIYFDNPAAWGVPDFLDAADPDPNGGFENGAGSLPAGWEAKDADVAHRAVWASEGARTGARCVRHEVDAGAEPNWLGVTRRITPVIPGAAYRVRAWVKADGVKGGTGWFVHCGSRAGGLLANKMFGTGGGTHDWKEVSTEFTAPEGTQWIIVGTSLHGTGRAWFDDMTFACDRTEAVAAGAAKPEALALDGAEANPPWPRDKAWRARVPVRFTNFGGAAAGDRLGWVSLPAALRSAWQLEPGAVEVGGRRVAFTRMGRMLFFDCPVAPRSRTTAWLYLGGPASATADPAARTGLGSAIPSDYVLARQSDRAEPAAYAALLNGKSNMVKNPDFAAGGALPDAWKGPPGPEFGVDAPGLFGARCARLSVPKDAKANWRGWKQAVPVQPGRTYLYSAWARCRDLTGEARLHAHVLDAQRRMVATGAFQSAGTPIGGETDWTLWQGTVRAPEDAAFLELHLTMDCAGTLWHDGVAVAEVLGGEAGPVETKPATGIVAAIRNTLGMIEPPAVWPVNAVRKVFREDAPPGDAPPAAVALARNEHEPLQLAIRSAGVLRGVSAEVSPPASASGAVLPAPAVHIVGFVPVDHPTSYYRSETPEWHRKYPTSSGQCDGWAGWWPDPLLPAKPFDLTPGETQPLWLTFHAPPDAAPGDYTGTIRLRSAGRTLREILYSVHVWNFTLPDERHVIAMYDVRPARQFSRQGDAPEDVKRRMIRFLSERRLCADRVPADPVFKREGDTVTADFAAFDAAAAWYFGEMRMPMAYYPAFFYMFGWEHPPRKLLGEEPYEGGYPYEGADKSNLRPGYKRVYQAALKLFWDHIRTKGWADKMVLYISDEPHFQHEHVRKQMQAGCNMIHEVDPKIPVYSSTWRHCPEWNGYLNVWGIGQYGCFPMDEAARRRADGERIWFTTDGQMCTDTPFLACERLLPHYCFHHGAGAYEFWGVDWLTYDPYQYGWHRYIGQADKPGHNYYVRYPNGDGFLAYPGGPIGIEGPVSSIRLEQAREGAEDYEYLRLLQKAAGANAAAKALLDEAAALVPIPNAGGRFSSRILPDPDVLPPLRRRIAEAIQGR